MEITCSQMDVLISFYIEGDLSKPLKKNVEAHLEKCETCRAKYEILKSMLTDLRSVAEISDNYDKKFETTPVKATSQQYRVFKSNLSAYVDNELPQEENIKLKKFAINNKDARKELENAYNIRKLMHNAFQKTNSEVKQDFSKQVLKELDITDEANLAFHPVLKVAFAFVISVLTLTTIIVFSLTL